MMRLILSFIIFLLSQSVFATTQDCYILSDLDSDKILEQTGDCDTRYSPASSFKIPLSLMGFDSGIFTTTTSPTWPYLEKYDAWIATQRQPLNPATWMIYSAPWYSQVLTQKMGEAKFKSYVDGFDYGNKDISGDPGKHNGLTHSWLVSSLKISGKEQLAFLTKMLKKQLPVSEKAYELTDEILFREILANGWQLYGKTGTLARDGKQIGGWFIGWVNKGQQTLVFVNFVKMPEGYQVKDPSIETEYAGPKAREGFIKRFLNTKY